MVQILRDQMRNYESDQSGAIRQKQLTQNVKEWGSVVQSVGKIYAGVKADQYAADKEMIDTQIGDTLSNDLLYWNNENIVKGIDPTTEEYKQQLYAKRDEIFQPYIDQMSSDKGRAAMQKLALDTGENIRKANLGKIAKNRTAAQAQAAFAAAEKQYKNDAFQFGKLGDWDAFQESTKPQREAMIKYAKKKGGDAAAAETEYQLDYNGIINYLGGLAESNPEQVMLMFGSEEDIKEMRKKQEEGKDEGWLRSTRDWTLKITHPLTGYVLSKVLEKGDEYVDQKKLEAETEQGMQEGRKKVSEIVGEELQEQFKKSYVDFANAQIVALKEQQKRYSKKSDSYKSIQNQIDEIQGKIDNVDSEPREAIIKGLGLDKTVIPAAKKQMEINAVQEKKMAQEQELQEYTLMLSPDQSVRVDAQMAAVLGQPVVEQLFGHSISNEEMQKATNALHESEQKVSPRTTISWTGTKQLNDAIVSLASYNGDNPLEVIKLAMDAQTSINNSGEMTEDQKDEARNIIYGMVRDKAFADTTKAVLENNVRYYPNTNWIENIFLRAVPSSMIGALPVESLLSSQFMGKEYGEMGLVSGNISTQDVDSVQKYLTSEYRRITKDLITMIAMATQLPTQEERIQAVNDAGKYMETEKRKVYDTAMMNYGIDLAKLREVKNTKGQAFTMIGTSMKEYVGDDPSTGEPIWKDLPSQKQNQVYLERLFGKNKSSDNNSAENKNGK